METVIRVLTPMSWGGGGAFLNGKRRVAQAEQAIDVAVTDLPRSQINHARYSTAHAQVWPDKGYPVQG